jgi:uncharacterized membrane protein
MNKTEKKIIQFNLKAIAVIYCLSALIYGLFMDNGFDAVGCITIASTGPAMVWFVWKEVCNEKYDL